MSLSDVDTHGGCLLACGAMEGRKVRESKAGLDVVERHADSLRAEFPAERTNSEMACLTWPTWRQTEQTRKACKALIGVVPTWELMKPCPGNFEDTCLILSFRAFTL